jgi:hypothetical protein
MADMERADDFILTLPEYAYSTDATDAELVAPRACQIIKIYEVETVAATVADSAISVLNAAGTALDDTLTIPFTGSAIGDVNSVDFRPNTKNAFAIGDRMRISSDNGSTVGTGTFVIVCRVL